MPTRNPEAKVLKQYTFTTSSVTETDKNLAMFATTIHFPLPPPLPEPWDLRDLLFWVLLFEALITTSKSHTNTCNFGSLEKIPTPSLTKDCLKLSLISPIDMLSTAPCKLQSQKQKDRKKKEEDMITCKRQIKRHFLQIISDCILNY